MVRFLRRSRLRRRSGTRRYGSRSLGRFSRRVGTRRFGSRIVPRGVPPHSFKRFVQIGAIGNLLNSAETMFAYTFSLDQLPNYTEFTSLYDQYMITKVVVKFYHIRDPSQVTNLAPGGAVSGGVLLTAIDHDDSTPASSGNEMRQYSTCHVTNFGKDHTRVQVPCVLRQLYETAVTTAYTPSYRQWISTNDPGCQHFGLKIGLILNDGATAPANAVQYRVEAVYYIKCKSVK